MNSVVSATTMKMWSDWKNMSQYFWATIMLNNLWDFGSWWTHLIEMINLGSWVYKHSLLPRLHYCKKGIYITSRGPFPLFIVSYLPLFWVGVGKSCQIMEVLVFFLLIWSVSTKIEYHIWFDIYSFFFFFYDIGLALTTCLLIERLIFEFHKFWAIKSLYKC
jgi:hypothetical protein